MLLAMLATLLAINTPRIKATEPVVEPRKHLKITISNSSLPRIALDRPKVEIRPGESEIQRREREEKERKEAELKKKLGYRGSSFTGVGVPKIIGQSYEQCTIYARRVTGNSRIKGYAGNIAPNSQEPRIGSGVLEKGHVSVLVALEGNLLVVHEANYLRGYITERKIPISAVRGFVN